MLHIILGILKIIGIILVSLLALLILLLALIVFVPIRYKVQLSCLPPDSPDTGSDQPDTGSDWTVNAGIRVSWLLHLLSARIQWDPASSLQMDIRLFGLRLPFFRKQGKAVGDIPRAEEAKYGEPDGYFEDMAEEEPSDLSGEMAEEEPSGFSEEMEEEPSDQFEKTEEDAVNQYDDHEDGGKIENSGSVWQRLLQWKDRMLSSGKQRIERLLSLGRRIRNTVSRLCRVLQELPGKISRMLEQPGRFMDLLERYEARALFGDLSGYGKKLLRHYKPRRIRGYLRFGTGDPAQSAQLTGLLYLLLPARADRFTIETEFYEPAFETDLICEGHLRMYHLLCILWSAWKNRRLRRAIRFVRKPKNSGPEKR
jgi:hypothetical protein